jgi:predicted KAP-like P-loop ATPase
MRIVTPPLIIEESDAFKNDILERKAYGKDLLNLVRQSNDELVISLDGKWGEGKTTFVKMWQGLLSESNVPNIYIDAFANDYLDDAFISIVSAIMSFAKENIEQDSSNKIKVLKIKAKKIGGQLFKLSSKVAIRAATLDTIAMNDVEEFKDNIVKSPSSLIDELIEDRLNFHSNKIALIDEFKTLLSEISSKIEGNSENPLVIIIDELDRCKPSFAIEILEKIKHLFSVKGVVFILVMHKEQLEEAVKCIYGQNIDAHTYLQKFINLETKLPKRTADSYANDLTEYSKKLLQLHEMEQWEISNHITEIIAALANHFNLSLRQLEKVFTNLVLFYSSIEQNSQKIPQIAVFLAIIKVVKPPIFDKLLLQKITYSEICSAIDLSHNKIEHSKFHHVMNLVRFSLLPEEEFSAVDDKNNLKTRFLDHLSRNSYQREKLIPSYAQQLNIFVVNK